MNPQRWARIGDIFGEAMECSGAARMDVVRRACNGDGELQREIQDLLASHERSSAFVDELILRPGIVREAAELHMFREGQLVSGRFRIVRFLGEGGMGEVYASEDQELHIRVALKTMHAHLAASPKFAERFRQEIQLARQVTHPNVCRIFDAGRHQGTPYFTMELLEGETLARRLENKGRMSPSEAAPIARQLCDALSAAHRAGVLHRDFKSANVMLTGGRAVITDFGLARLLDADSVGPVTTGLAVGTPAYMPPEQIEGRPSGASVDIYALGVVMYEMLTGLRPYRDSSPLALAAAKLKGPSPPRKLAEGIGSTWEAAILKCLSPLPEDRFADALEVLSAVEGTLRLTIRRSGSTAGVVAAILALAAGFGLKTIVEHRPPAAPSAEANRWYREGVDALGEGAFLKAENLLKRAVSLEDRYIPAHARLAEAYSELDMSDKAKDEVIHATTLAPDRSRLPKFDAQLLDAAQLMVAREFSRAEQAYSAIAEHTPASERGRAYLDIGRAAEKANHIAKAMDAYQLALVSSPQREVPLLRLARLSARQGKKAEALVQLKEAGQLFQLASNYEGVTETKLELARLYASSNLPEAESQTRSAIETAKLTGNAQQQVKSRFELSRVKLLEGHAGEAALIAEEAIGLAESLHLENLSVQGLNDLAAVMTRQLKWKEVQTLCQRALVLARRSRSRAGEARALFYLAQASMDLDDNDAALRYLSQAVPYYREGGDSVVVQDVLALESDLLCAQGRYAEAKADAAEMQKWGEAHNDDQTLMLALQRAAEPRMFEGDYAGALSLYQRETDLEKRAGRRAATAYALINQADMFWRLGQYDESADRLLEAQSILPGLGEGARGPRERLDLVQAEFLLSQLRVRRAQARVNKVLASSEGGITARLIAAQTIRGLALVRFGELAAGKELCARALRTAEAGRSPASISLAHLALAEAAFLARDPEAARLAGESREYCLRSNHAELALRALLLEWAVAHRSGDRAHAEQLRVAFDHELASLEKLWGAGSVVAYRQRPDIRNLMPPR
jgi:Tfp pilus assembly protein PilF